MERRRFVALAAAFGASLAWARKRAAASGISWRERRDLFPEGVASGDPAADSVILWTRYPRSGGTRSAKLTVEVAEDEAFRRVVATARSTVDARSDWTCRVLVAGLEPAQVYWYRFTDSAGEGSRVGRTITAPADTDARPVRFTFVSCQNANQGAQSAYRRMIYEDERADPADRLAFVLHLGDFIYEIVWYPEDRPNGMYDRRLRDLVRYASGEKIDDFHVPTTVDDYRAVYRAYLHDPDLQDARARWPFVAMWDNHEFSWLGWQSIQQFGSSVRPAQTRKVAANQAWFEYQPARVAQPRGRALDRFDPPAVTDTSIVRFDEHGLGQEPNNLLAIGSLTGYRAFRFGHNIDLIITDQRSYRSEDPGGRPEFKAFSSPDFPQLVPEDAQQILDGGRAFGNGTPPESIPVGGRSVPNFRRESPPQTILGATQKAWFLDRLARSTAPWKIWGSSLGTLDWRADPQNLPPGMGKPWIGAGFAGFASGDYGSAWHERGEIYDFVRAAGITGFATVAGDRHSFWAGLAAKSLPPAPFEPVGISFVTGSVSAPGIVESLEHNLPKDHPLRPLYLADRADGAGYDPLINVLMRHGVRACLEYHRTRNVEQARRQSNPDLAPHLAFIDMGGHGYTAVRVSADSFETEFVCIPRPLERSDRPDGAPLVYRVTHRAKLWGKGERPVLEQRIVEGNPAFSI
jgi:alkaline phosphatase D